MPDANFIRLPEAFQGAFCLRKKTLKIAVYFAKNRF